ncbi:hypothetical protein HMPREF3190_00370 [Umbribacter vaginalis]|nr:hypothetical protein HMPREF3190_00370 [Coriobacteriales bacterium DNF00809]
MEIIEIVIAKIVSKVLSHLIIRYLERREKEKGSKQPNREP